MSKELLTVVLEACQDFNTFLTVDLAGETLTTAVETRRQQLIKSTDGIIDKIRSSHVSVRPRLYTPSNPHLYTPSPVIGKKPAPKPPAPVPQELYVECEGGQEEPEDYETFESKNGENDVQETYESMANNDELYEEPAAVPGALSPSQGDDEPQVVYEEPIASPAPSSNRPTPTPPASAENSGSGAVYTRTNILPSSTTSNETATEWMYDTTKKEDKKMKATQLDNVSCRGNLEKLGGKNKKNWQVRYCVLSGPLMYFYEKETSKTYRNRIALPLYTVSEAPEHTNAKKRHFAFKLTHTDTSGAKKDYFFKSSKKESCETWIKSMRDVNERTLVSPPTQPNDGGNTSGPDGGEQELYEPIDPIEEMTMSDEEGEGGAEEDLDDYVDVVPVDQDQDEYIDVDPSQRVEDEIQEEYEDTSQFQSPSPVPPPFNHPTHVIPTQRPPTDAMINTNRIYYTTTPNGITLDKVYVALWDFISSKSDELSVHRGDLVLIVDPDPSADWWAGEGLDAEAANKTGSYGFLPSNYFVVAFEEVA